MDTDRPAAAATALGLIAAGAAPSQRGGPRLAAARAVGARALRLALRRPADAATSAGFYLLVAGLLALATAPFARPTLALAAAAAWVGALLASLLAQQQGLREDVASGALDQLRLAPEGPLAPVAALLGAQVLVTSLPLLAATPLLALFFQLSALQAWGLVLALVLGLPAVCILAAFASALTLAGRGGPALLGLLALPLAVPLLLFGVRAADPADGGPARLLLLACSVAACALGPFAVSAALTLSEDA
jgi:heme exporter protein B